MITGLVQRRYSLGNHEHEERKHFVSADGWRDLFNGLFQQMDPPALVLDTFFNRLMSRPPGDYMIHGEPLLPALS